MVEFFELVIFENQLVFQFLYQVLKICNFPLVLRRWFLFHLLDLLDFLLLKLAPQLVDQRRKLLYLLLVVLEHAVLVLVLLLK